MADSGTESEGMGESKKRGWKSEKPVIPRVQPSASGTRQIVVSWDGSGQCRELKGRCYNCKEVGHPARLCAEYSGHKQEKWKMEELRRKYGELVQREEAAGRGEAGNGGVFREEARGNGIGTGKRVAAERRKGGEGDEERAREASKERGARTGNDGAGAKGGNRSCLENVTRRRCKGW